MNHEKNRKDGKKVKDASRGKEGQIISSGAACTPHKEKKWNKRKEEKGGLKRATPSADRRPGKYLRRKPVKATASREGGGRKNSMSKRKVGDSGKARSPKIKTRRKPSHTRHGNSTSNGG